MCNGPAGVRVASVAAGSPAARMGIGPGDRVLSVSGEPVLDLLDLHFLTGRRSFTLRWASVSGAIGEAGFRPGDAPLGITPEPVRVRRCRNKCLFCFVHQLPRGLRRSLYIKDEDVRLSFLHGAYVTFSDVTEEEVRKIIRYRMSPLYVSIHTSDPELRRRMLGNPDARNVMRIMRRLVGAGLVLHGQIVVCPGINDGEELGRTLRDVAELRPGLATVSVVPVGLTAHRKGLPSVHPVTPREACDTIALIERFRKSTGERGGEPFVTPADEYYLLAGRRFPGRARYGSYAQIGNGVGLVRRFLDEARALFRRRRWGPIPAGGSVVTGMAPRKIVSEFLGEFSRRSGVPFAPLPVENRLMGAGVTVTGLLAGRDIAAAARAVRAEKLFVPSVCLRDAGDLFLDSLSPDGLSQEAGAPVMLFEATPRGFYEAVSGSPQKLENPI